jgi:hypothetical protein
LTSTDNGVNLYYSNEIPFNPYAKVLDSYSSYVDTRDGKEVMPPTFLSDNTITVLIKFKHVTSKYFKN